LTFWGVGRSFAPMITPPIRALVLVPGYAYSAPAEDLKLKK
jgi:hypothetical protein